MILGVKSQGQTLETIKSNISKTVRDNNNNNNNNKM